MEGLGRLDPEFDLSRNDWVEYDKVESSTVPTSARAMIVLRVKRE